MRKALEALVVEANKITYTCLICNKLFSIEEAVPNFVCNICPNSNLVKKESNIPEAKRKRDEGVQQIKHMESLMRECIDVTLPSAFFGALPDSTERAGETSSHFRLAKPPPGSRNYIININLPEAELEIKDNVAMTNQHDADLLKYYQKLDKRSKRKKIEENGNLEFYVQRENVNYKNIKFQCQQKMDEEEFQKYYEWRTGHFLI